MVNCPRCGNNSCNGGSGDMIVDGEVVACDTCAPSYVAEMQHWQQSWPPPPFQPPAFEFVETTDLTTPSDPS